MRKILIVLISCFSLCAHSGDPEVERKINELNQSSVQELGISLNALAYLMSASGHSYMPKWSLEKSGEIHFISELEAAGYVTVREVKGLPSGHEPDETFINIRPLKTGKEIQRCMQALQHNQSSNSNAESASS